MTHVIVLGLVLTLVAGVVSFAVLVRRLRGTPNRLPASIPTPLLLYNLWIAGWLVSQYVGFYVLPQVSRAAAATTQAVLECGLAALSLAWLRAHLVLVDEFLDSRASRRARAWGGWFVWGSVGLLGAGLGLWLVSPALGAIRVIPLAASSTLVFPLAVAASVLLAVGSRRQPDEGIRRALGVLSICYIALFTLLTVLLLVWRTRLVDRAILISADLVLELSYNVLMVAWANRFAPAFAEAAPAEAGAGPGFDALCESFRISPREREIIELVCQGLTNREIAARLFISIGTVKDHNYTIFQKAGVRNRTMLAQLFTRPADPRNQATTPGQKASHMRRVV